VCRGSVLTFLRTLLPLGSMFSHPTGYAQRIFRSLPPFLIVGLALIVTPVLVSSTQGKIFFVTETKDTYRVTCLRGAILQANRLGGNNIIILGPSDGDSRRTFFNRIYRLTISGAGEDEARTGDLDITRGRLTIMGSPSNATIDATGLGDRVFHVFTNASLTLSHLVISGGTAVGKGHDDPVKTLQGGAFFNSGILTMRNCSIVGNSNGDGATAGVDFASGGPDGGGCYNEGVARLSHCEIRENSAGTGSHQYGHGLKGGSGGGVYNSGTIILDYCGISGNSSGRGGPGNLVEIGPSPDGLPGRASGAGGDGGDGPGICNIGKMVINCCTVNGNFGGMGSDGGSGAKGGAGGSGGGIFNLGTLDLKSSTVTGNHSGNGGMGGGAAVFFPIHFGGDGGDGGDGGGIYNAGSMNLISCTIVSNETGSGGGGGNGRHIASNPVLASGGRGGNGGGVSVDLNNSNISMGNTLIAMNLTGSGGSGGTNLVLSIPAPQVTVEIGSSGSDGLNRDVEGSCLSQGFNLISIADGSTGFTNGFNADLVGSLFSAIDPRLGPLKMNGGTTPTHALLPGSPAIDQGNSFGVRTDQRGHRRPHDFPRIPNALGGDGSDIGAFELK
jgi:hypothetical protein